MLKLVRLNSETLTIKRTWQGAPVSFGHKKNVFSVYLFDVNKQQLCDPEPIICSFVRLGNGSMGISHLHLTHGSENLLHHIGRVSTPHLLSRKHRSTRIYLISCVGILQYSHMNESYKLGLLL